MRFRFMISLLAGLMVSCLTLRAASESKPLSSPSYPRTLSLSDVYLLAQERSETLGISREEIKIAEAQYWQAISAILPKVDFLATERAQNSAGSSIGGGDATGSRKDAFQGRLRVTQTIFNGFREFNIGAALQAQKRSQEALYRRSRELLYLDCSDLFYQVLSLEQDGNVLRQINDNFMDRQKELTDRVGIGRSRRSELLAADTEQADNAATMEEVRGLLGASRELLAFLIGLPSDRWQLKDTMPFPEAQKLNDYLWKSGARADVTAAIESQTAAQRQVSADKGSFWPKISAEANYLALEDPEKQQEWNIVLTAEVPLFDGGLRAGTLKESEARLRSSSLNFSRARRLAESEVRQSYNNFISSARQYLKLQEAVDTSRKNYEAQKEDYLLGRASNLDSLTALVRYNSLRRRLAGLEFQTRSNLVALQVAAGTPDGKSESSSP
jgi:outer membrane protein